MPICPIHTYQKSFFIKKVFLCLLEDFYVHTTKFKQGFLKKPVSFI